MRDALVVAGPGLVADPALLGETAEREFAALGVRGGVVHARDAAEVLACMARARDVAEVLACTGRARDVAEVLSCTGRASDAAAGEEAPAIVVVPGPLPEIRALMSQAVGPVVWLDLARVDGAEVGEGAAHLHGRGIEGLAWAIRHAVHRLGHPRHRIPYGPHRDQYGELYFPEQPPDRPEGAPLVVLVHGGNWRSVWAADLMDALALDLAGRGLAVWNLEYRRPDLHGWRATTGDVAAGLRAPASVEAPIDPGRVAVVGHSAGAQLALRAVADGARVSLAVSLAGMLDLVEGARRWVGTGAVAAALGANAGDRAASPLHRLPLKVPQLVVQGSGDELDLVDFSRRYARAAQEAGDDVTYLEMPGDHFAVIDPRTPIWRATAQAITAALR